jgi:uncharacterized protein (DUF1800 family)
MRVRNLCRPNALVLLFVTGLSAILVVRSSSNAQQVLRKMSNVEAASHALNRLAFGPRPGQAVDVGRAGWEKWAEQQLQPESIDDRDCEKLLAKRCPSLSLSVSELQSLERNEGKQRQILKQELVDSVILRAVYSKRQFNEVIVDFWRNHFNVDVNKVPFLATHYEENVLRKHAFGKFEDLLMAVAKHPAMLVYLDNYVSRGGNVNENYARELMELHTLGVDNGYTQNDVIALARVLTGWTCGWQETPSRGRTYGFIFNNGMHDDLPGTVVGLQLDGSGGVTDGEKAIRHLAHHDGTAHFISRKLCRYLVNDNPPKELVDRVAYVFRETDGDLTRVYRAIILGREFMDPKNYRAKFKTPFEFVIHVMRTTDAQIDSTEQLTRDLRLMGQSVYECLEPTGYYDQAEAWLDPGVMVYRWNFAIQLVQEKVPGVKIGREFAEEVLQPKLSDQVKKIMQMTLPGVTDPATEKLISRTSDIRAMAALAIGSPAYQQQ